MAQESHGRQPEAAAGLAPSRLDAMMYQAAAAATRPSLLAATSRRPAAAIRQSNYSTTRKICQRLVPDTT